MLVKWNGDGLLSVLPIDPEKSDGATAAITKPIMLFPGWNDVPDDAWNLCKIHAKDLFDKKKLEEISEKVRNEQGLEVYVGTLFSDISNKKPTKALELIKDCFNPKSLEEWGKSTSRDELRTAVKNQLDAIAAGKDIKRK